MGQVGNYKRNVTYFYQYHNGNVGATAGFLKMEVRGDNVKITINIQESSGIHSENPVLYFYHETGDNLSAVKICEVYRHNGVLTLQTKTSWKRLFNTGRDLYTFDGVIVLYNVNDYYLGDFNDRDRSSYDLIFEKDESNDEKADSSKKENKELLVEISSHIKDFNVDEGIRTDKEKAEKEVADNKAQKITAGNVKINDTQTDSFDEMLQVYPKLSMGGAEELFDCVRINPKDIGKLDISNWKLGSNSFLSHGFYTYQYLMLGRMRFGDGKKHAVLGVPGVYNNREKYLAGMFGFDQFIPVKKTGVKTGQFGYWIVELSIHGDRY